MIDGVFLLDEAKEAIGRTLYDQEEAEVISKYLHFYNDTFEGELPDSYYINHPKWTEVVDGAKKILEMMEENNKKYDFAQNMAEWDKMDDEQLEEFLKSR